jgi:arabinogalactan oligomer/maltooligosaccharide transport system permease protein
MLVITLVPVVYSIYIAFTNFSTRHLLDYQFVGLRNFQRIVTGVDQKHFFSVLSWTVQWTLLTTLLSLAIGLVLAILLNNPQVHERNVYRTILVYPWALPGTLTIMVWGGLLNSSFGPVNQMLQALHLPAIPWLTHPGWARVSCILVNIWLAYPFMMSVCLGALQSVDPVVYEAAAMDGAGAWQMLWRITLPLLRRATMPLLITSFAMNFSGFGVVFLLTGGGPTTAIDPNAPGATDLLGTYMYRLAFGGVSKNYGLASATGIIIFIFVGGLTLFNSCITGAFAEAET